MLKNPNGHCVAAGCEGKFEDEPPTSDFGAPRNEDEDEDENEPPASDFGAPRNEDEDEEER
jgi:hypothetical protein